MAVRKRYDMYSLLNYHIQIIIKRSCPPPKFETIFYVTKAAIHHVKWKKSIKV